MLIRFARRGPRRRPSPTRGQALVEFMLVFPLFVMTFVGIIVLGMGVFFQQQVTNVAREAARFASVHSGTAVCPTFSNLASDENDYACPEGAPWSRWPQMTAHARSLVFGLHPSAVRLSACWSGYWTKDAGTGVYTDWDALP
ncbi:MAG: TadE family protein, partial [Candidatus Limnocylindria bacterium]